MVQHVDPENLALLALGEQDGASSAEHAHLASCPDCRQELAALGHAATTARAADDLVAPADEVWDRVRSQIASDPVSLAPSGGSAAEPGGPDRPGEVVHLSGRRRPPVAWLAAAAGVALVAGVAGGIAWEKVRSVDPEAVPTPSAVASAELAALPEWAGSTGTATVQQTADGARQIVVQVEESTAVEDAYQEVWLLAEDLSGMVSLGVLDGAEGTFPVPDGIDLERYAVVDVSAEPFDGDPTHSGDSIVRGGLTGV
jgi:hypothetical protein